MRSETELVSTFGNRNFLAAYLSASIIVGVGLWSNSSHRETLGIVIANLVMLVALALTHSRGAWLALAVSLTLYVLVALQRWRTLIITCGAVAILAVTIASHQYIASEFRQDVRPSIWKSTLQMVAARPFLGHGLNTFAIEYVRFRSPEYFKLPKSANLTDHAHNELLEVAAEQGIVGLTATLCLWATVLITGFRRHEHSASLGLVLALLVFILHSMVDVDLRHPPNQQLLWLLLGLVFAGSYAGSELRWRPSIKLSRFVIAPVCACAALWTSYAHVWKPILAGCYERRARIAEAKGNLESAGRLAANAVAMEPLNMARRYYFAGILSQIPSADARAHAIEQAEIVQSLAPDYSDITFNLGQLLTAERRYGEALPYLQRAVKMNPYNADKRFVFALVLHQLRHDDEARGQIEAALKIKPTYPLALQLQAELSHKE